MKIKLILKEDKEMLKEIMKRNITVGGYVKFSAIICAITIIGEIVYMIYIGIIDIGKIVTTIKSKFSKKKSD